MFNREKMLAALRWLASNPDKHAEVDLAYDAEMNVVSTLDPKAECFCALGRYAVEMGVDTQYMDRDAFGVPIDDDDDDLFTQVWSTNDDVLGEVREPGVYVARDAETSRKAVITVDKLFNFTEEEIFQG